MNSAKKILKNQGLGSRKQMSHVESGFWQKNKVLLIAGLVIMAALVGVVCYINLRPRAILKVEAKDASGGTTTHTIYYKEAMYDIYIAEQQYNSLASLYQQFYGTTYWEAENIDNKGNNGSAATKSEIMKAMKKREILYLDAVKNGLSLTDDEKNEVEEKLQTFRDGLTKKQKKMFGLDEDTVRTVLEKQALADKYKEQIIEECNIDEEALKASVSQEDYRQYEIQYYTFEKTETDDDGNSTNKSAAVLKKAKKNMKALQKKAAGAEDFTQGMITDSDNDNEDDETGIVYETVDLLGSDTDFASEDVLKAIKKMKNDEVSGVLEDDDAYYVVKMVDNNNQEAYEEQCTQVVEDEKEAQFKEKYQNEIKINYTATAQSYWKGIVTIGYLTYDDAEDEEEESEEEESDDDTASGAAVSGTAASGEAAE